MRVLGIDCGTERTGYGVIASDGREHRLVTAGVIRSLPPDPFGGRYFWDPQAKEVRSSVKPFRFRVRPTQSNPEFHYKPPAGPTEAAP